MAEYYLKMTVVMSKVHTYKLKTLSASSVVVKRDKWEHTTKIFKDRTYHFKKTHTTKKKLIKKKKEMWL